MHSFLTRLRQGLTMTNGIALAALVLALGGGSAIALKGTNTVDSGDIKKGAVKSSDLRDGQVTGIDVNEDSLAKVPAAKAAEGAVVAGRALNVRSVLVDADGKVSRAIPAGTKVTRTALGTYTVDFGGAVAACVFQASLAS